MESKRKRVRARSLRVALATVVAAVSALALAACGSSGSGKIRLVAYSTPGPTYTEHLIPAFQKTPEGKGTSFSTSFASSGDQSKAVEAGQAADILHLSLQPDMDRVIDAGVVPKDWDRNPQKGFVQTSVVAFMVRKGNPKGIETWDDLVAEDVEIITPNVFSSGSAKWNLMAAYGAALNQGKSEQEAQQFLKQILEHTSVQPPSASDALTTFEGGKGDVLLTYENDAIAAEREGKDVEHVVPDDTILIQTPFALTKDASANAKAFAEFAYSPEAQQIWADQGYRPSDPEVAKRNEANLPTPSGLFTIDELGGWDKFQAEFFDPEKGVVAGFLKDLGVSTSG